jgi:uncharacterized repeat protein (TIGR03843 family)
MAGGRAALDLLSRGAVVGVRGRMPWSSNATFLAEIALDGETALAVYKPERGERPLWDFPPGLYKREAAAYHLSEALGWGLVPPTVCRDDGPYGEGSLQLFVPADFEQNYFTIRECPEHREQLARICLFDIIANNADRKGGHCLLGEDGAIYAIDNGLTFHTDWKLRTVIWEFGGAPIPRPLLDDVRRVLRRSVPEPLADLLDADERAALLDRARAVVKAARFPQDTSGRRYPWPLV